LAHKARLTRERSWEVRAVSIVQRAAEIDGASVDVQVALGEVYWALDRHALALEHYDKALGVAPECSDAWIGRARSLALVGRGSEAEQVGRRAVELVPEDWRAWNALGRVHYERGDYRKAEDAWRKVVELVPDHAAGQSNLGTALLNLDRLEEAVD